MSPLKESEKRSRFISVMLMERLFVFRVREV
jgi:hypothetical protein